MNSIKMKYYTKWFLMTHRNKMYDFKNLSFYILLVGNVVFNPIIASFLIILKIMQLLQNKPEYLDTIPVLNEVFYMFVAELVSISYRFINKTPDYEIFHSSFNKRKPKQHKNNTCKKRNDCLNGGEEISNKRSSFYNTGVKLYKDSKDKRKRYAYPRQSGPHGCRWYPTFRLPKYFKRKKKKGL
ncbi:hypothetical protein GBBBJNDB_00176 [Pseudomonas phage Callisto]|nr:hypothetical protein GBBBJNDB_00176 [Pseudomonas phage Callisto]WPK39842.1 hypothetical protein ETTORE_0133 [Pseudomonas phage Ettore]